MLNCNVLKISGGGKMPQMSPPDCAPDPSVRCSILVDIVLTFSSSRESIRTQILPGCSVCRIVLVGKNFGQSCSHGFPLPTWKPSD